MILPDIFVYQDLEFYWRLLAQNIFNILILKAFLKMILEENYNNRRRHSIRKVIFNENAFLKFLL